MLTRKRIALAIGTMGLCAGMALAGFALLAEPCPVDDPCQPTSVVEIEDFQLLSSWLPALATADDAKILVLGGDMTKLDWTGKPLISGRLFDHETGQARELFELQMRYPPDEILFSPDNRQMAIYCTTPIFPPICLNEASSGMLVDLADGTVIEEFEGEAKTANALFDLPDAFTDQSRVVPGTDLFVHALRPDGVVVFFSLADGTERHRISLPDMPPVRSKWGALHETGGAAAL